MSDLRYQVLVDAARGNASLNQLQNNVEKTSSAFQRLQNIVAGLAIGATIRGVLTMSNRLTDLSSATGIATQKLIGFSQAVAANGGSLEIGERAIQRFGQTLGNALDGSTQAIQSFENLGISLNDLRTLSQEEILARTVRSLSEVENASQRASRATELFGRSVSTVDFVGLNNSLGISIERAARYAPAVEAAGNASQGLADSMRILQLEVAVLIQPLTELVVKLTENKEAVAAVAEGFVRIVAILAGATIFKTVAASAGTLAVALGASSTGAAGLVLSIARLATPIGLVTSALVAVNAALKAAFNIDIIGPFAQKLGELVTGAFNRVAEILREVKALWDGVIGNENIRNLSLIDLRNLEDSSAALEEINRRIRVQQGLIQSRSPEQIGRRAFSPTNQFELRRFEQILSRLNLVRTQIEEIENQRQLEIVNEEQLRRSIEIFQDVINRAREYTEIDFSTPLERAQLRVAEIETTIRGLEEAYAATNGEIEDFDVLLNASNRALQQAQEEVGRLERQLEGFSFRNFFDDLIASSQRAVTEIQFNEWALEDLELALQNGAINQEVYAEAVERVNRALGRNNESLVQQENNLERINDLTKNYVERLNDRVEDARFELESLNMTPLERQIARINRGLDRDLRNAVQELQRLANESNSQEIAAEIERITESTRRAQEAQAELARQSYEHQRSFAYGWSEAFREYKERATDAASTARRVFEQTTRGLEDAIVGFVKTGKFEWRSFVSDILETLLRANIRRSLAGIFEATGLDRLFGTSSAEIMGITPGETPQRPMFVSVVNGREIMPSGVFTGGQTSRIQNNIQDPFGGMFGSLNNIIGNIGSLFGGFFATGGQIPAGRFGVVGERGRELISGPTTVTPFEDLVSNITYNINAVDARSFKELVASDPGFIYAVTQQGARGIPGRRV